MTSNIYTKLTTSNVLLFVLLAFCFQNSYADKSSTAAIASAHPLATEAGLKILNEGGNAFDAAVAVTATLAVVEPMSSGLGGGGFWLLHRAKDKFETMLDGRETAPLAATRDMYLDEEGNVIKGLSITGPLSAGIPGIPAAQNRDMTPIPLCPLVNILKLNRWIASYPFL